MLPSTKVLLCFLAQAILLTPHLRAEEIIDPAARREIIQKAIARYYNLPSRGFKELRCEVGCSELDKLDSVLGSQLPPHDARLLSFSAMKLSAKVDQTGQVSIQTGTYKPSGNKQFDQGVQTTFQGLIQVLEGAMRTWKDNLFETPLPPLDSDYRVFSDSLRYTIIAESGGTTTEIVMTKDYLVQEVRYSQGDKGPESVIRPGYLATKEGLLMNEIDTELNNGALSVRQQVTYKELRGMMVPSTMHMKIVGSQSFLDQEDAMSLNVQMSFTFYNHRVMTRN